MAAMLGFFFLFVAGLLMVAASLSTIRTMSKLSKQVQPEPRQPLDLSDQYEVHAESIFLPTNGDWGESIQTQLNKIEDRDPTSELVSVAAAGNRLVLFYKVRKQKRGSS